MKSLLVALCLISSLMIVDSAEASHRSRRGAVVVQAPGTRVVVQSRRGFSRPRNQVNVFVR